MNREKITKDPFLKILFSPIMIIIISLLLIWIQSISPVPFNYNETNPLEIVGFYWFYAGVTHVFWIIKQWFLSIKKANYTDATL
jgi:hypothetical protein